MSEGKQRQDQVERRSKQLGEILKRRQNEKCNTKNKGEDYNKKAKPE